MVLHEGWSHHTFWGGGGRTSSTSHPSRCKTRHKIVLNQFVIYLLRKYATKRVSCLFCVHISPASDAHHGHFDKNRLGHVLLRIHTNIELKFKCTYRLLEDNPLDLSSDLCWPENTKYQIVQEERWVGEREWKLECEYVAVEGELWWISISPMSTCSFFFSWKSLVVF